jgi:hypothetical protein
VRAREGDLDSLPKTKTTSRLYVAGKGIWPDLSSHGSLNLAGIEEELGPGARVEEPREFIGW